MKPHIFTWSLAVVCSLAMGVLAASPTMSPDAYTKLDAAALVNSPQSAWARAIMFSDVVEQLPTGRPQRLDRQNYVSMRLATAKTVWIPEHVAEKFTSVQVGQTYTFTGTADQISRKYYIIVDACYALQTAQDMSERFIDMLNPAANLTAQSQLSDSAMQAILIAAQNKLIALAKEGNVTVGQLLEAHTDGGQRIAEKLIADALQGELKAKNKTAEEVMIASMMTLLHKQAILDESRMVAQQNAAADFPLADLIAETPPEPGLEADTEVFPDTTETDFAQHEEEEFELMPDCIDEKELMAELGEETAMPEPDALLNWDEDDPFANLPDAIGGDEYVAAKSADFVSPKLVPVPPEPVVVPPQSMLVVPLSGESEVIPMISVAPTKEEMAKIKKQLELEERERMIAEKQAAEEVKKAEKEALRAQDLRKKEEQEQAAALIAAQKAAEKQALLEARQAEAETAKQQKEELARTKEEQKQTEREIRQAEEHRREVEAANAKRLESEKRMAELAARKIEAEASAQKAREDAEAKTAAAIIAKQAKELAAQEQRDAKELAKLEKEIAAHEQREAAKTKAAPAAIDPANLPEWMQPVYF